MKKQLSALAIAAVLLTAAPKPAQAAVSIFAGGVPLAIGGAVLLGSSQVGALGLRCIIGTNYCFSNEMILLGSLVGIVMLDEQGELQLSELSAEQASKIGVSEDAALEFNSSRTRLSQIASEVNNESKTQEEAAAIWKSNVGDTVSQEAFDVYVKIIAAELKK